MKKLVKENIQKFAPYIVDKEPVRILLNANESPYNLFQHLKEEFIGKLEGRDLNRYPDTDSEDLRKALAKYLVVQKENIICGNGSDEIIQMIIHTFVGKGDTVIIPTPTFSMYGKFSSIGEGKVIEVPSYEDFKINVGEIIEQANKNRAKLIFLCNPNNPTGTLISREFILEIIQKTSSMIVLDEAYGDFCKENNLDLIKNPKVIILRTFSKAFSLAGARLGYGISHKNTINTLYKVKSPYNLNTFSQLIGEMVLENVDLVKRVIEKIIKERDRVFQELKNIKTVQVYPSHANFIFMKSEKIETIIMECKKEGIAIRDYSDPSLKEYIRLSIGTPEENDQVLNIIKGV
ncbi:histidinol-phosphate transaminase [Garciella nitratireducens]|uniref:histidinol-phosphate transaminase n=1 Tax=Garciella nitratireducens TaxID=218205 RepID=UPI000DEA536F|nr:histidinol-phosphate transaminase [Garciella nitratireducens]RBP40278.1 histidinol phosphate aminotransferase [Garciella nitratireducens]